MKRHSSHLFVGAVLLGTAAGAWAQDKQTKEAADKLHAAASQEPNSGKAAEMLCKAASMVPKNADFQKECREAKIPMVDTDHRNLQRASSAFDEGKLETAKTYAGNVTSLDPSLHAQAQTLLAKIAEKEKPTVPVAPVPPPGPNPSVVALGQAQHAFDSGDLAAAKAAAQQVTESGFTPAAKILLSEIDHYNNDVNTGRSREEAKDFQQAINAYQAALEINPHVGGDDLTGKIQRLKQQQVAVVTPPTPNPVPNTHPVPPVPGPKPSEPSPEEKKKKLVDAYNVAMARKDMEGAERALRQEVQLDPHDTGAQANLSSLQKQLAEALNRDPVKLEKTLHDAIAAFYASQFEDAESALNRYLGADAGKKKGAAYFYLGATEEARALLEGPSKHSYRETQARDYFKQARSAGYQPVQKYVSEKILHAWQQAGA